MNAAHAHRLQPTHLHGRISPAKGLFAVLFGWHLAASVHAGTALEFDFTMSDHGFVAGFADYPTNATPEFMGLASEWRARPAELGGAPALFITGNNHSDDLFMYWKKRISGLRPNTTYVLTMEIELASKYPTGSVGIGGSPGDSVYLKTGATAVEPLAVESAEGDSWWRMNLDKGNQSGGGSDMPVRGTIAKLEDGNDLYVSVSRHHHGQPQPVTTAADGSLWLVFGTDSGFEGTTSLYYTRLTVWLNPGDEPCLWCYREESGLRLVWNDGVLVTTTNLMDTMGWTIIQPDLYPYIAPFGTDPVRFWRIQN